MSNTMNKEANNTPISDSSVYESIRRTLADVLCIADLSRITRDADIAADLGAESIDFVDLSFRVEQEFGIAFDPEALRSSSGGSRKYPVQLVVDFVINQLAVADRAACAS